MTAEEGQPPSPGASPAKDADESWPIYLGTGTPHDRMKLLRPPPPWRTFHGGPTIDAKFSADVIDDATARRLGQAERARAYRADDQVVRMVNAALYLRRPLLVTGRPGTGKSTLAYSIAYELQLGPVLYWPITSRSTLAESLYQYDALARLQEASLQHYVHQPDEPSQPPDIGRFIRLGPLGTALLPRTRPRVLLIDELDKSDIDLPNDLLHVFEEGRYVIPELARLPSDQAQAQVFTADGDHRVPIGHGQVSCHAFPVVIITSNGEREFPPAFHRRCLRLTIASPDRRTLAAIVAAQLGPQTADRASEIIQKFIIGRESGNIATDQLLNAIYFATSGAPPEERDVILDQLISPIDSAGAM